MHIKVAGGRTFLFEFSPRWNIAQIKAHISSKIGMKVEEISIIFAGKSLGDDLLLEVNIQEFPNAVYPLSYYMLSGV